MLLGVGDLNMRFCCYIADTTRKLVLNRPQNLAGCGVVGVHKNYEFMRTSICIFIPNRFDKPFGHWGVQPAVARRNAYAIDNDTLVRQVPKQVGNCTALRLAGSKHNHMLGHVSCQNPSSRSIRRGRNRIRPTPDGFLPGFPSR